jgi:transcriptional regulator with XRE-family HTH domain
MSRLRPSKTNGASGSARPRRPLAGKTYGPERPQKPADIRTGEIAAVVGVTPQAVSNWEAGRSTQDAAHALAYARALAAVAR